MAAVPQFKELPSVVLGDPFADLRKHEAIEPRSPRAPESGRAVSEIRVSIEQMRMANAFCRYLHLALSPFQRADGIAIDI